MKMNTLKFSRSSTPSKLLQIGDENE